MTYEAHKEQYKGFTIKIMQDDDAQSPDDWDQAATIYTKHNRYFAIGKDLNKIEDEEAAEVRTGGEWLPIYAYVHSGVTISTSAFSCPWDSGQCGFIVMSKEKIIEEYGDDTPASREKAKQLMVGEVTSWDTYLKGEIYGYIVEDKDGEHLDSCWGYYGDYREEGGALSEARSVAERHVKDKAKKRREKVKALIKGKAPLHKRGEALA